MDPRALYAAEKQRREARERCLLEEARSELAAWDREQTAVVRSTRVVFTRPRKLRECPCGAKHFAKGLCSRCYFREYNSRRPDRPRLQDTDRERHNRLARQRVRRHPRPGGAHEPLAA